MLSDLYQLLIKMFDKRKITESTNKTSKNIDFLTTFEIVKIINDEDKKVAYAVEKELKAIAEAVDLIVSKFKAGGRLVYIGTGTSGRMGVLDASECPPTFGIDYNMIQAIIAGGDLALRKAVEYAEDDLMAGAEDVVRADISDKDVLVGITANGDTPYVKGALLKAKEMGAATIGIMNNIEGEIKDLADIIILADVGPEVIAGSTRMKAGTSQKMILNMLTTTSMIKMGRTYKNLMVDMIPTNDKLRKRAVRIVMEAADVSGETALEKLEQNRWDIKATIVSIIADVDYDTATSLLKTSDGYVRIALEQNNGRT